MGKKIYIGNLSFATTEDKLSTEFSKFGQVDSVRIIIDKQTGKSKGFGFVEMTQEEDAAKVIATMNGINLDGRKIRVNYAEEKPRRDFYRNSEKNSDYSY